MAGEQRRWCRHRAADPTNTSRAYTVGINSGNLWALFSRENVYRLAEMPREPELFLNGRKNHYYPEYALLGTSGGCTSSWVKTLLTIRKLCIATRDAHNVKRIVIIMIEAFLQNDFWRVHLLLQVFLCMDQAPWLWILLKIKIAGKK